MEWKGIEWNGMEWNAMEWNQPEWNGMDWNQTEWKDSITSVDLQLVFIVEEPPKDEDPETSVWPIRVQVRSGTDLEMRLPLTQEFGQANLAPEDLDHQLHATEVKN